MKCIILAGRKGEAPERPREFLPLNGAQSLFQETVARNLPLCDEMNICAPAASKALVRGQMEAFRELTWRMTLEEEGRGTYPAILLSILQYAPSEILCVVPADWAVSRGDYRGDVLKAMDAARQGRIAVVGEGLKRGILIFENGLLLNEVRKLAPEDHRRALEVFRKRELFPASVFYSRELAEKMPGGSIEKELLSRSPAVFSISASFNIRTASALPELSGAEPFVRLKPAFKDYLWGGTRLRDQYKKHCDYPQIAESWELSAHPLGESVVTTGVHRGLTFGHYLSRVGREAWGWKGAAFESFPLLVKFLDAREDLSIQVHPDDAYALEHEGEYGKNEMWYVVDSAEGARVALGFKEELSREQVVRAVEEGNLQEYLNWVEAKKGDVFFIPAGTVHAVGRGCFIMEIQQSSNVTYRLYDYGRRDRYGNLRQLQLDKALEVMSLSPLNNPESPEDETEEERGRLLCSCKYFVAHLHEVREEKELLLSSESFVSLVFISGRGELRAASSEKPTVITYWPGDCVFLPASDRKVLVKGPCTMVEIRL